MEKDDKEKKPGVLGRAKAALEHGGSVIQKGLEAAKKGINKLFTPEEIESKNDIVAAALIRKLSSYYNGIEPEIINVELSEEEEPGQFNVSARVLNLLSTSQDGAQDVQEANLMAEVEVPQHVNVFMSDPGIGGIDTMHANLVPVFNIEPVVYRIALEITNSTAASRIIESKIRKIIAEKYPFGRLIDRNLPLDTTDETLSRDHLIVDSTIKNGRKNEFLRLVKFPMKKVPVEKKADDCLTITDYEYQLEAIQELYTVEFPDQKEVLHTLKKDKKILHKQVVEFMGSSSRNPFRKLFFSIRKLQNIELKDNAAGNELVFSVDFDCVAGFTRSYTVSTDLIYALEPVLLRKTEKTLVLRYLRHDYFIIRSDT